MGTTALRGVEHAAAFLRLHEFMREHLKGSVDQPVWVLLSAVG
jgi:hypothetical protein